MRIKYLFHNRISKIKYILIFGLVFYPIFGSAHTQSDSSNPPLKPISAAHTYTGGDFTLTTKNGPVSLKDFRGKAVMLFFGFTQCPDVCPTTMQLLAEVIDGLDEKYKSEFNVLFVTLDPERDSAHKIYDYTQHFHKKIIGLTGTRDEIQKVAKLYGVQSKRVDFDKSGNNYGLEHSGELYLIMRDGKLGYSFPIQAPGHVIKEAVRYVLSGKVFK